MTFNSFHNVPLTLQQLFLDYLFVCTYFTKDTLLNIYHLPFCTVQLLERIESIYFLCSSVFFLKPMNMNSATNLLKLLLLVSSVTPFAKFSKNFSVLCICLDTISLPSVWFDLTFFSLYLVLTFFTISYIHLFIEIFNELILYYRYLLRAENLVVNKTEQDLIVIKVAFKYRKNKQQRSYIKKVASGSIE